MDDSARSSRQSVARISEETGIHICTLYVWRKRWRLEGEVVPATQKDPDGWGAADKFKVVLETAGLTPPSLAPTAGSEGCIRSSWSAGAGIAGCQREASGAHVKRTEGAGEAPRPGPARDKTAPEGAA